MSRATQHVVIAGAGPVGLALAGLLAHAPGAAQRRVHVLDVGAAPHWNADQTDLRVYALSRASERLLGRLEAWDPMRRRRVSPYRRMRIWEHSGDHAHGELEFDCAALGEPDLGHIVEDSLLRYSLHERLRASEQIDFRWHHGIDQITVERAQVVVTLGGERIHASLLIAADGAQSTVRELAGFRSAERDYGQRALVTHVRSERPHAATAWQRFLPGGPMALLPLADGRSSVVWSLPSERAEQLAAASESEFVAALQQASDGVLGRLEASAPRTTLPLVARHVWRYCAHRVALVGDAAHTVHPLAGLGMNLGMLDVVALAECFAAALARGEDPGDHRVLRRYERARKGDNLTMLLALDGLERLFRLPRALAPLRAAGLGLVDRSPLAKRVLMHRALGLAHLGVAPR